MLENLAVILLMYISQGCTQGLVFATVPMLLGKNSASTDADQSTFSLVGYPFSLKFIIAPLVDAYYWPRVGKRESWLIPLQAVSSLLFALLAASADAWLKASPPAVSMLVLVFFSLTLATATQDIATDAYAADHLADGNASSCQTIGLTVGIQATFSIFFALSGRGYLDLSQLLQIVATTNFALLGALALRQGLRGGAAAEESSKGEAEAGGVPGVVRALWRLVRDTPNLRLWVVVLVTLPAMDAHATLLGLRYQDLGFSPELFAEYDIYMVPIVLATSALAGRLAECQRPLTALVGSWVLGGVLSVLTLLHFWRCRSAEKAIEDPALKWSYVVLSQVGSLVGTVVFVLKFAFCTRIAARTKDATASVITFLASVSNLGQTLAGTWAPHAVAGASGALGPSAGLDAVVLVCTGGGLLALLLFLRPLRRIEDLKAPGWE
mmetsp:Transcript_82499/g.246014  ORF Transcript_82499/g.246014 Transcript_82499/m.246014 type:complete len:438 (+) Transcript_82499:79-1392(+)